MIELSGVVKRLKGFTLGPLDLTIREGFVTGLVGANGAGKTTTIKILLGMVLPGSGSVVRPEMGDVGVVLDTAAYDAQWSVSTVGRVLRRFYPRWSDEVFSRLLAQFNVPPDLKVRQLSRGMGMKLQIAAAFAHDARLLILDEPTSGLDPLSRDELADIVGDFMTDERRTVLFSSHITSDIERIADYVTVMDKGSIVEYAERSELIDAYRIVHGGATPATSAIADAAYGMRRHDVGWDALVPSRLLDGLPDDAVTELPTLDDLVVRIAKGHVPCGH